MMVVCFFLSLFLSSRAFARKFIQVQYFFDHVISFLIKDDALLPSSFISLTVDSEDYFLSSDDETNTQLAAAVYQIGGGHFHFVLDPVVQRQSNVMGEHEPVLQTCLKQQRGFWTHGTKTYNMPWHKDYMVPQKHFWTMQNQTQ